MIRNPLYKYGDESKRVPAHLNFGKEVYDNMVRHKDIVALINSDTDERITYGELAQMTADIALSLVRMGVKKGDIISICSERNFVFLPTVFGIMCAGAVLAPIDLTYGSFPLIHRMKIVRPKIVFCSRTAYDTHRTTIDEVGSVEHYILYGEEKREGAILFKDFLTETTSLENFLPVPVDGTKDLMLVLFSSGTTGLPKGIPTTHLAFLLNIQVVCPDAEPGTRIFNTREWYYTYGLLFSMGYMRSSITMIYSLSQGQKEMLEAVQKYKVKGILLVPVIVTELVKSTILDDYDLSSLQYVLSSSTYIKEDTVTALKKRLPNLASVLQLYGMSEGGSLCNEMHAPKGPRAGSSGVPSYGLIVKVVDLDTRQPLGPHQRGEICVAGLSVMKAYLDGACPDCKDEEGFLKTGDIGYYDEDGYFYIVNRIKEMIKYKGISIPPAELEAVLLLHPAVREAGVVGLPHPDYGEVPTAFVALQPGCTATEEEVVEHLNSWISQKGSEVTHKMHLDGGVRFVDRLPRGSGDKLNRQELKQWLEN